MLKIQGLFVTELVSYAYTPSLVHRSFLCPLPLLVLDS